MSLFPPRLLATLAALLMAAVLTIFAQAATSLPDSTWVQLAAPPGSTHSPVFALAVDPNQNQIVVGGTTDGRGEIFRSMDGGSSWTAVRSGTGPVLAITFSPFKPGWVLAGLRGGGVLSSTDAGATWSSTAGIEGRTVRVFGFARSLVAAGTDHGVYVSRDGAAWTASGLATIDVDALGVAAVNVPVRLVVAGRTAGSASSLVLYESEDAATSWSRLAAGLGSSTIATRLVAGPLPPPPAAVRPLLAGTNLGLFSSKDNGATFVSLTGGGSLPATDITQAAFVTDHYDHFYVASDGGGSDSGGVWFSSDGGQQFSALLPPMPAVTAMSVSNDEAPLVYEASFSTSGHSVSLWAFHDTGGRPQPASATPITSSGPRVTPTPTPTPQASLIARALASPSLAYIALAAFALAVLGAAAVANVRARHR